MLRFLLLEDNASDSQLIQQVLRESQIEHQIVWVETRADFLTALSTTSIDLILASYHLPGLTGSEALELTLQTCPEIPFIVVLGTPSEELAIDLLNQGATDYVSKQHLGRLIPTVNRALREVRERCNRYQAETMLTEQKRLLEQIATGHPLDDCLAAVCTAIAQLSPRTRACFLLVDAHRQTFPRSITPEFPPSLGEALKDAPINDLCIGTGGEAVYRGEPITCADIAHDNRWSQDWRNACIAHSILACHSKPVMGIDGLPVGSLMLCFSEPRSPTEWEYQLANFGTQVASVGFERDRAILALRTHENQLQTLFEAAPLGIYLVNQDFRIQHINPIARPVFGDIPDLIGRDFDEVVHILWPQAYADEVVEQFRHTLATGEPYIVPELIKERADRKVVEYYEWQLNRIPLPNGHYGAVCYFRDISAQVLAHQAHIESESRFRLMVESANDYAIFTLNLSGIITSWNAGAERLLGYSEPEAIGSHSRIIFTPEDNAQRRAEFEMRTALTQGRAENERWHIRKDGSRFWASGLMMPLLNEVGNAQGFVNIFQDKTVQKQANARLRVLYQTTSDLLAAEQPLTLMHNLFKRLAVQLDLHYFYNFTVEEKDNRLVLHLSNYEGISEEAAQAIEWIEFGQHLCGLVAQERRQIVFNHAQIASHPNAQLLCTVGTTAYVGQPLLVKGKLIGTLSFASRTRTYFTPAEIGLLQSTCEQVAIALEQANLTASLQQQAEQLRQANRIKDEFLAVLSHELRSPLNPILGWTHLLKSGKLDELRQQEALDSIERNAKLQTQLIEDLLDISRIMQGKLTLTTAPVSLTFVISSAAETVRLAAEAKQIQIALDLGAEIAPVLGDAARLQQVVWNLLTNAVKFTPKGGKVTVELRHFEQIVQIRVIDTGKGISPDFLPHVFEYFRQADATTTRKFGGLGLGLAIVRQIVEMHGGVVEAESLGDNHGAVFTVQLPIVQRNTLATPTLTARAKPAETSLNNLHILLVDDDDDTRQYQTVLLERYSARVTAVASGQEALQALDQFMPDIVVSDIGMAEMDGYMLIQHVRSRLDQQNKQIPAIALTAYAREFDQQRALQAGFQAHITKPVEPEVLVEEISRLLR